MDSVLPIGKKHGCFTIIGGFEVYQEEVAKKKIADLEGVSPHRYPAKLIQRQL
ncbi:hypothetical protein ABWK42_02150 [Bacillus sp. JJ927]|uniref:hypothetical protein n=1 Tax=Bacillus TaxID=1386 RepID=UPI0015D52000|nr:hypothetical protein [Bacillus cereus]